MNEEKSLTNTLRAVPDLLRMEETRNFLMIVIRQLGIENLLPILLGTVRRTGLIQSITSLLGFKLGKISPNLFASMWDTFGDKREAIISGAKRFTFREYKERVFRLANGMRGLGLGKGDRVVVLLPNGNEYLENFGAGSLLGYLNLFTDWHMRGEHLLTYLKRQNPKAILFTEEFADRITEIKDQLEGVERYIVVGEKAPAEAILYEDLISRSPDKMPEETSFITSFSYSTGGTTGVPKHTNYYDMWGYALSDIAEAPRVSFGEYLKHLILGLYFSYCYGKPIMEENDNIRCLVSTPMHHAATSVGWLPPFLFMGGTIVPMSRFDAEEFLRLTERERCNWTFVVPTMLQRILALPDEVKRKYDLSSMRSLICASAPCPIETKRGINELFMQQGCKKPVYCEYYGSSETGVITVLLPEDYLKNPKCIESVGSPRCGDLRIFNDEEKRICSPNEIGKVMVRTNSTIQLRYYGTPEKLQNVLKTIDGKEFFDDELLGYVDEDDFLYLTGREKEMIIVGGVNIYPDEVEKAVLGYPKVLETAIIPIPDKDLGEVVGCVVQPKKGEKITEEEIIEYCKKKGLYGYAVPRKVEIMEELPRSMGGKMLKDEIMKKYWEDKGIKRRG